MVGAELHIWQNADLRLTCWGKSYLLIGSFSSFVLSKCRGIDIVFASLKDKTKQKRNKYNIFKQKFSNHEEMKLDFPLYLL